MTFVNKVNTLKLSEFEPALKHQLNDKLQDVISGVLTNANCSWLAWASNLIVVSNKNGAQRTSWTFGTEGDNLDITCVTELPIEKCKIPLLIVGISSEKYSSICIFNPNTRKLIRTLQFDIQVRCIAIVGDGDKTNINPLPGILGQMSGVLAIGGADGSLILIDLKRDYIVRAIEGDLFLNGEDTLREVIYVNKDDTSSAIQFKLRNAQLQGDSLAITLIEGNIKEDIGITALTYSKENTCLYVGFSCGTWELWDIFTFTQLYSSPESEFPVFGFGQLTPCDDPRHTIYVWVAFQSPSQTLPLTALYSMSYGRKTSIKGYGSAYEDFKQCNLVFEMSPGEEVGGVVSSRIVSVETVSKTLNKSCDTWIGSPNGDGTQIRIIATTYIIETKSHSETRLLLFDLNRWYAEQMPSSVEEISAILTKAEVTHALLDLSTVSSSQLITLSLLHNTVNAFTSSNADNTYGQISIELIGISMEGIIHAEKLSAQRQWLRNSELIGPRALIQPLQLYKACVCSGLSIVYSDYFDIDNATIDEMRSYILSVWLETKMYTCIMKCADSWSNGSHSVSGCTLAFLLDWLWGQFVHCKTIANHLSRSLFNISGIEFDPSEKKKLLHCRITIKGVHTLYTDIVQKYSKFILSDNTDQKIKAMSLFMPYLDQVMFFTNLGILPEQNHLGMPRSSVAYDSIGLKKYVSQRKLYLDRALDDYRETRTHILPLSSDGLYMVNSFNISKDNKHVIDYPPHDIQLLVRVWLKMDTNIENKFALCYYFLLDLMNICDDDKYRLCMDKITSHQFSLGLSNSQVLLVKALWNLDHSFYEDGMKILMSSQVRPADITDVQNRCILRLLFVESRYNLALQYMKTKHPALFLPDDLKFEMSLLLSNHVIHEAHQLQRRNLHMRDALLMQFFSEQDINDLKQTMNINLDLIEEEYLIKFLNQQNKNKIYQDLHLMLLISRGKYMETIELQRKLKSQSGTNELITRGRIVDGMLSSIPSIGKLHPNEESLAKAASLMKGKQKPLSYFVKTSMDQGYPVPRISNDTVTSLAFMCCKKTWDQTVDSGTKLANTDQKSGVVERRRDIIVRPKPAPPSPFLHRKRLRNIEEDITMKITNEQQTKRQKLEATKEALECEEIELLLATPIVERKHAPRSDYLDATPNYKNPQSILKKIGDRTKTPLKEDGSRTSDQQECLTPRKSLRFTLPKEDIHNVEAKSGLRLSPRRALRTIKTDTDDLDKERMDLSSSSTSSSTSSWNVSDVNLQTSNKSTVVSSTPLKLSLKTVKPIEWSPIIEASKTKTLFSIGVGSSSDQNKVKPWNSITTASRSVPSSNITYSDIFLKKVGGIKPPICSTQREEVDEDIEEEGEEDVETNRNEVGQTEERTSLYKNSIGNTCSKDNGEVGGPRDNLAIRQTHRLLRRSSNLVEELLATPRTTLKKRFGETIKGRTRSDLEDDEALQESKETEVEDEFVETEPIVHTTKRIEMHIEKKIRMEVRKEVEGVEEPERVTADDDIEEMEGEEGGEVEGEGDIREEGIAKEKNIEIIIEDMETDVAEHDQIAEKVFSVIEQLRKARGEHKVVKECEVEEVNESDSVLEEEELETAETKEVRGEIENIDVDNEELKIIDIVEAEKSIYLERSAEGNQEENDEVVGERSTDQKENAPQRDDHNVESTEDMSSALKITTVCSLNEAGEDIKTSVKDYKQKQISDPVILGAVAPTSQPLQNYFSRGDNDGDDEDEEEEDDDDVDDEDDLYGGLDDAEEAEMPPKMVFGQREVGFGGIYEDLYEQEDLISTAPAVTSSQKQQDADSESSVICLDSDSEPESHHSAKEETKLDYEGEEEDYSLDADESNSTSEFTQQVHRRSFFHDKFGERYEEEINYAEDNEYEEVEDEDVDEEEENEEEEDQETEEEVEQLESHSEISEESSEVEQVEEDDKKEEEHSIVHIEQDEQEIIECTIDQDGKEDSDQVPIMVVPVEKEPESSLMNETDMKVHSEGMVVEEVFDKEITDEKVIQTGEITSVTERQEEIDECSNFSLRIEEVSTLEKSDQIEGMWISPVIEEVDDNVEVIITTSAESSTKKGKAMDEETLAALALKRVEELDSQSSERKTCNESVSSTCINIKGSSDALEKEREEIGEPQQEVRCPEQLESKPEGEIEQGDETKLKTTGSMFNEMEIEEILSAKSTENDEQVKLDEKTTECISDVVHKGEEEHDEKRVGENSDARNKDGVEQVVEKRANDELENVIDKVDLSVTESETQESTKGLDNLANEEVISTSAVKEIDPIVDATKPKETVGLANSESRSDIGMDSGKEEVPKSSNSEKSLEIRKQVGQSKHEKNKQSGQFLSDILTLGKGQMFFGSPENLNTSGSELATFQVGRSSLTVSPDEVTRLDSNDGGKQQNQDEEKLSELSSADYSMSEMDVAMIVANQSSTNSTPSVTPSRKRRYRPSTPGVYLRKKYCEQDDEEDMSLVVEKAEDIKEPSTSTSTAPQVVEERSKSEIHQERLNKFKQLVDRSMNTENKQVPTSNLDYLELCIPNELAKQSSKTRVSSRNRRATSEQPRTSIHPSLSSRKQVDDDNNVGQQKVRHTRASLDVARIYPRKSEISETSKESSGSFSLAEYMVSRRSLSTRPSTSAELQLEEVPQKQLKRSLRERRNSRQKDSIDIRKESKVLEVEGVEDDRTSVADKSSPSDKPVEDTPRSIKAKRSSSGHSTKSWKTRLDFNSVDNYELSSIEDLSSDDTSSRRTSRKKSLPTAVVTSNRRSSRVSVLPKLDEVEEETNTASPTHIDRRRKCSSLSPEQLNIKKSGRHDFSKIESSDDTFISSGRPTVEGFLEDRKKSKKPRSLPDLSSRKRGSTRFSTLPKVIEEEDEHSEGEQSKAPRGSSSTSSKSSTRREQRSSRTHSTKGTLLSESSLSLAIVADRMAKWADKMSTPSQAKWWTKIAQVQQNKSSCVENVTSSVDNSAVSEAVPSTSGTTKRSKNNQSASTIQELPHKSPQNKNRGDDDVSSVDSDRTGRSTRSRKDVESIDSDRNTRKSTRTSKKSCANVASSVSSEKSFKTGKRKLEVEKLLSSPFLSETNVQSGRRRKEVESSPASSEKSAKRRRRTTEDIPSTSNSSTVGHSGSSDTHEELNETQELADRDIKVSVDEYAQNRRLTRYQKSLLERSLSDKKPDDRGGLDEHSCSDSEDAQLLFTPTKPTSRSKKK